MDVSPPRLALADLVAESLASVAQRPARLLLTTLGTVLGTAAIVATVGLAQTASGQVGEQFDAVAARQVVVRPRGNEETQRSSVRLPWDAPERVSELTGVVSAGTFSPLPLAGNVRSVPVVDPQAVEVVTPVVATSAGLLDAVRGSIQTGRYFDAAHDARHDRVAVLGINAAERLHITRIDVQPSVLIGDDTYVVIGIVENVLRRPELLDSVIVPNGTARDWLQLSRPQELHIRTQLGAAQLVGHQAPIALAPNEPELFRAEVPPSLSELQDRVQQEVNVLFVALGGVALLAGAVGIANVTLLSVLERVAEIGLRRALGATRRHVAVQFLFESMVVGLLGGLLGAVVGVFVTLAVSLLRDWTPLLDSRLALVAPILGAVVGVCAGAYPAWKSSSIEPIAALRRHA